LELDGGERGGWIMTEEVERRKKKEERRKRRAIVDHTPWSIENFHSLKFS
jgi:hypothetical protein